MARRGTIALGPMSLPAPRALDNLGIKILTNIATGNFAKVMRGVSASGPVAVKIIDLTRRVPGETPQELYCLKNLSHANIIRYISHVKTDYSLYIVMEFAENGSLFDYIMMNTRVEERQARRWFKQLLNAVAYCHNKGVVHRDIKCENILLTREYVLKLADFGLSRSNMKMIGELSETYCGSPVYSAPEILQFTPYVPQYADVWSMGVVLFVMIYGYLPFTDRGYKRILRQVQCKVRFPATVQVSPQCQRLITKMIAPLRCRAYIPELIIDPWVLMGLGLKGSLGSSGT